MSPSGEAIVSSDHEPLILVDENDEEIGHKSKLDCHVGEGMLHRAFSIFIFNEAGETLLQRRSAQKFLWPGYWSNACCSHPRLGETMDEAIHRRLEQELGFTTELGFLYKFIYKADYKGIGTEHELCWVWVGRAEMDQVVPNSNEIEDWRFVSPEHLEAELAARPGDYTPWMKMEWRKIRDEYSIC